jgi:hypothetical protein
MDKKAERLILKVITRYRRAPRIHVPVIGSMRNILIRNSIYSRYLGKTAASEFLLPELRRYFAYALGRLKPSRIGREI